MSCDLALSAAILLASFHPGAAVTSRPAPSLLIQVADVAPAPPMNPLAREPLYADIVKRAAALRAEVQAYQTGVSGLAPLPNFDQFKTDINALSELDMQGHVDLAKRGTDGDLKCILKGISQDLPRKLTEVEAATTADARASALKDMFYL
ncbi:MAG: hypothetical protein ACYDD1_19060, partial [Caulobacteraceae bacterium]